MNANQPHKRQVLNRHGREQEKGRASTKTKTSGTGQPESRKIHASHRRQMGVVHDARRQTANRQSTPKPDVPLMKTAPSTVSHRTVPDYFTVEMLLVCVGFVTAICLLILFGLDLVTAMPFSRASLLMDVSFLISSLILGYLSWNAYRDLV